MSLRGNTVPPDGCPKGRSTAPAGCAAGSRMTTPRFGISERPWMPPSSCWKSSNFSHEKTLPGRGWQTPAAPGQEAFLTPYLTTVRAGTRGNSGFKSAKKYRYRAESTGKHYKSPQKIWFKRLGARCRVFESLRSGQTSSGIPDFRGSLPFVWRGRVLMRLLPGSLRFSREDV